MRVVAKIDAQGLFLEDRILADGAELPAGHVESRPPDLGFHRPKWDAETATWVEGKPASEILAEAKAQKVAELKVAFRAQYEPTFVAGYLEPIYLVDRLRRGLAVPQADRDRLLAVDAGVGKFRTLASQVEAATTTEELESISWE